MMGNPRWEEDKVIKDVRYLFRLKQEQYDPANKDIRNLFRLKEEFKWTKDIVRRKIKDLFEYEKKEENYYKPVR